MLQLVVVSHPYLAATVAFLASWAAAAAAASLFSKRRNGDARNPLPPLGPSLVEFLEAMAKGTIGDLQMEWRQRYGQVFRVKMPPLLPDIAVVASSSFAEDIMLNYNKKMYRGDWSFTRDPNFASITSSLYGKSVTGMVGEEWRWRKMAILKQFHNSNLLKRERGLVSALSSISNKLCIDFEAAAESGAPYCVVEPLSAVTQRTIMYLLFGREFDFSVEDVAWATCALIECLSDSITENTPWWIPSAARRERQKKAAKAREIIDSVTRSELRRLMEEMGKGGEKLSTTGSLVECLIRGEPRYLEGGFEGLVDELRAFIVAGFETTANALVYTLRLLAESQNRPIQDRAAAEAIRVMSECDGKLSSESVQDVPYINGVFAEACRLMPLAPVLGGKLTKEVVGKKIVTDSHPKSGVQYRLRKNTAVLFCVRALQMEEGPRLRGSSEMDPTRWDPAKPASERPQLFTFHMGPHACPGRNLSFLEARVFLTRLLSKYEFSLPLDGSENDITFHHTGALLARPKGGFSLIVRDRRRG